MKVIHPICAGIDIHKKSFTIALNVTKANGTYSVKTKTFSTMQSGIISSRDWLLETNCIDVALESTVNTGFQKRAPQTNLRSPPESPISVYKFPS